MSAVSKKVIPASSAAPTTRATSSGGRVAPKLLHPRPAVETTRPLAPSWRYVISVTLAPYRREDARNLHRTSTRIVEQLDTIVRWYPVERAHPARPSAPTRREERRHGRSNPAWSRDRCEEPRE